MEGSGSSVGRVISNRLVAAKSVPEIFELVSSTVRSYLQADQAGLLLAISDLGNTTTGAFYVPDANTIVVNKRLLARIRQTRPETYNFCVFHVVLHEYVHALGMYDEQQTRQLVHTLSEEVFGSDHLLTKFAADVQEFFSQFGKPEVGMAQPQLEYVLGIDRKNTWYIA